MSVIGKLQHRLYRETQSVVSYVDDGDLVLVLSKPIVKRDNAAQIEQAVLEFDRKLTELKAGV